MSNLTDLAVQKIETEELSEQELAYRVLVMIFSLANGSTDVVVSNEQLLEESRRIGVKGMTDAEFEAYRLQAIERAKQLRCLNPN